MSPDAFLKEWLCLSDALSLKVGNDPKVDLCLAWEFVPTRSMRGLHTHRMTQVWTWDALQNLRVPLKLSSRGVLALARMPRRSVPLKLLRKRAQWTDMHYDVHSKGWNLCLLSSPDFSEWPDGKNSVWLFLFFHAVFFVHFVCLVFFLFIFKAELRWFRFFHGTSYYFRVLFELPTGDIHIYIYIISPGIYIIFQYNNSRNSLANISY